MRDDDGDADGGDAGGGGDDNDDDGGRLHGRRGPQHGAGRGHDLLGMNERAPVPGRTTRVASERRTFAHPGAVVQRAVLGAHGAAKRIEAWSAQLMGRIADADYLESGRLSLEIRWGLARAARDLDETAAQYPDHAAAIADRFADARARLSTVGAAVALLLRAAPKLEAPDAAAEAVIAAWTAWRRSGAPGAGAPGEATAGAPGTNELATGDAAAGVQRAGEPGASAPAGAPAWAADVAELAPRLGLGAVDVRADDGARAITEARGARGVAQGDTVHLHPARIRPGTREGREVLAHELVHLAQARLPAGAERDPDRAGAEREAAALAGGLAAGGAVAAPRRPIDLSRPAADTDALPDPSSRYGVRVTLGERKLGKNVTVSAVVQAYLKDQDGTGKLGTAGDVTAKGSVLSQEAFLQAAGDKLVGQIATSAVKLEGLWDLDELSPLPGLVDLTLKVEAKLFDAAFTADQASLDLARVTFAGEADITQLVIGGLGAGRTARAFREVSTIKLAVRLVVRLPAEVVADLYRLHQAKRDLQVASRAKQQLKAAERALAKAEKKVRKATGALWRRAEVLKRQLAAKARHAAASKVWGKARDLGMRAGKTMAAVGARLAKTAAGRAASTLAVNAMKLVPGLNLVMAGKDLIEAGVLIYQLIAGNAEFRFGGGDGGGAQAGSDEPGEGSAEIDGERGGGGGGGEADGGEAASGEADAGDEDAASDREGDGDGDGPGAGGDGAGAAGDGTGDAPGGGPGGKGGHVVEPDLTAADLDPPAPHAVAAQILSGLEVGAGHAGHGLALEDREVIGSVIPPDLDPGEIAELLARVQGKAGGEASDPVTAIVAALEEIRPDGARRAPAAGKTAVPARPPDPARDRPKRAAISPAPAAPRRGHAWRAGAAKARRGERVIVDPRPTLEREATLLPGPRVQLPVEITFNRVVAKVHLLAATTPLTASEAVTATVWVRLEITRAPADAFLYIAGKLSRVEVERSYAVKITLQAPTPDGRTEGR